LHAPPRRPAPLVPRPLAAAALFSATGTRRRNLALARLAASRRLEVARAWLGPRSRWPASRRCAPWRGGGHGAEVDRAPPGRCRGRLRSHRPKPSSASRQSPPGQRPGSRRRARRGQAALLSALGQSRRQSTAEGRDADGPVCGGVEREVGLEAAVDERAADEAAKRPRLRRGRPHPLERPAERWSGCGRRSRGREAGAGGEGGGGAEGGEAGGAARAAAGGEAGDVGRDEHRLDQRLARLPVGEGDGRPGPARNVGEEDDRSAVAALVCVLRQAS